VPSFQNIHERVIKSWRSTVLGVAGAALIYCPILIAQGITLGHAGKGTVVALILALATATIGALKKDKPTS
jgi:hypothetical protein